MWRLIFLALVVALIVYLFKRQAIKPGSSSADSNASSDSKHNDDKHIEDMVQCAQCSVHLPRSEAYLVGGQFYCSKDHIKKP